MLGSGTQADPYIIQDVTDLQNMNNDLTAYYELEGDIDASITSTWNAGAGFLPVGNSVNDWRGHFDGKGYTISGLFINRPLSDEIGLFGRAGNNGGTFVIQNVTLLNVNITGDDFVGALIGNVWGCENGLVSNCHSSGTITGDVTVGGLGGDWSSDNVAGCTMSIINCSSSCTVSGRQSVGGLLGIYWGDGEITDCFATGDVTTNAVWGFGGGLIGQISAGTSSNLTVSHCYATGNVNDAGAGGRYEGGFSGQIGQGNIQDCYATGDVNTSEQLLGGFVGFHSAGTITRCYAMGDATSTGGTGQVGGFVGENDGTIVRCFATGNAADAAGSWAVGGFAGDNDAGTCTDCFARGNAVGGEAVGGFVGSNVGTVENCYSTGTTTTDAGVDEGGFCGDDWGAITNCFWDMETSGDVVSDGGTGRTTVQMKSSTTFIDAGWNFATIWAIVGICNDGYPCLLGITPLCILLAASTRTGGAVLATLLEG